MKENFYETIYKRKSFHLFKSVGQDIITQSELMNIERAYAGFECMYPEIRTAIRIVPADR